MMPCPGYLYRIFPPSQEQRPELVTTDSNSQTVSPKFDKEKRCVARESLLEQGEKIMNELASNRAMLEIHYENEVCGMGKQKYEDASYGWPHPQALLRPHVRNYCT